MPLDEQDLVRRVVDSHDRHAFGELVRQHQSQLRYSLRQLTGWDEALAEHIRENVAGTFHPVGTCRMGAADDRDAVTDTAGRVRGFESLRVVDASLMPTAPRGNTNIPTIMLAEKISAAIDAHEQPRR